jgi:hypothetical protein
MERVSVLVRSDVAESVRRLRERAERLKVDLSVDAEVERLLSRLVKAADRELAGVESGRAAVNGAAVLHG